MNKITIIFAVLLLPLLSLQGQDHDLIKKAIAHPDRSEADLKRDERSKPLEILSFVGASQGMVVADVFSSSGYYSELLSHLVGPKGKVIAHNNQAYVDFVGEEKLNKRYMGRLPNVEQLRSDPANLDLPKGKLDLALMVMTYHDLYHVSDGWPKIESKKLLRQLFEGLKPGGHLLVVDHAAREGSAQADAQKLHRIEEAFALKDFRGVGFELAKDSKILRNADDNKALTVFDPSVRGKTDRFVLLFRRPR